MDEERFDRITRTLASGQSRRGLLKGLGGMAIGGLLASIGLAEAGAQGNSANAKRCKNGNWATLAPSENPTTPFASQGACISYGARGGTIVEADTCAPDGTGVCDEDSDCCSGTCQAGTCVATVNGTCTGSDGACGNGYCLCFIADGASTCGLYRCAEEFEVLETCPVESRLALSIDVCEGRSGCFIPCPPIPVCFTGETQIAMADGTSRPIERVAVGDFVLGQGGINRVLDIERPTLESKPLYALNDGPFFVTADHPFLTETGWKAINPALTVGIPNLVIGRLAVGDRLLALAGVPVLAGGGSTLEAVIPELVGVAVERIGETQADPATPLYNLRLDGDHTYFANEMVVHNR